MPASAVGRRQAAGIALSQSFQCLGVGRNAVGHKGDPKGSAARQHFPQMPKQAEAGDIRAGVYCPAMGLKLIQQSVLTAGHVLEHRVQSLWLAGICHGSREQHAGAQGTA